MKDLEISSVMDTMHLYTHKYAGRLVHYPNLSADSLREERREHRRLKQQTFAELGRSQIITKHGEPW